MQRLEVKGITIKLEDDFVSLTDIAKQNTEQPPKVLVNSWLKNRNTLLFLEEWETVHNPNFKGHQMVSFMHHVADNRNAATPQKYVELTNAAGMYSRSGRGGGTFAHRDIALSFCYWLSPPFQVWLLKKFQELLLADYQRNSLEFHIAKITDHIDEARNWLDTIPNQNPARNRLRTKDDPQK